MTALPVSFYMATVFFFAKSCLNHQGLQSNFDTSDRRHPAGHVHVQELSTKRFRLEEHFLRCFV